MGRRRPLDDGADAGGGVGDQRRRRYGFHGTRGGRESPTGGGVQQGSLIGHANRRSLRRGSHHHRRAIRHPPSGTRDCVLPTHPERAGASAVSEVRRRQMLEGVTKAKVWNLDFIGYFADSHLALVNGARWSPPPVPEKVEGASSPKATGAGSVVRAVLAPAATPPHPPVMPSPK